MEDKLKALDDMVQALEATALSFGDKDHKVGKHLFAAAEEMKKAVVELKKELT